MSCRRFHGLLSIGLLVTTALLPAACGKKGPPLAPLRQTPARTEDLTIRRLGNEVYLQFTIPSRNADNTAPADLERIEAYAITGKPEDPSGQLLEARDFLRYATRVAAIDVKPAPPPDAEEPAPAASAPADPRPGQGERVTMVDTLTESAMVPFEHPLANEFERRRAATVSSQQRPPATPIIARVPEVFGRVYVVAGRSRRNEAGPLSARLFVPLTNVPASPGTPTVKYDASKLYLEWPVPAGTRMPPASAAEPAVPPVAAATSAAADPPTAMTPSPAPAGPGPAAAVVPLPPLIGRPLLQGPMPHTYNVYEVAAGVSGQPASMPTPLNPKPLIAPAFEDTRLAFGVERCYIVRMVEAFGVVTAESAPSPPVCVTPRDTFPPAPPFGLSAVGSEDAINLIWDANTEPDFAGYIVLRGEAPGTKLDALTPTPIRETTYRDASIKPGVRYVYAVLAVDAATPQNMSAESNRVEETAR